jgi:hypothetical protein
MLQWKNGTWYGLLVTLGSVAATLGSLAGPQNWGW